MPAASAHTPRTILAGTMPLSTLLFTSLRDDPAGVDVVAHKLLGAA